MHAVHANMGCVPRCAADDDGGQEHIAEESSGPNHTILSLLKKQQAADSLRKIGDAHVDVPVPGSTGNAGDVLDLNMTYQTTVTSNHQLKLETSGVTASMREHTQRWFQHLPVNHWNSGRGDTQG